MQKKIKLNVAFIPNGTIYDEVVKEIMLHQGIPFVQLGNTEDVEKYFCIITPEKINEINNISHINEKRLIIVKEVIPLNEVLSGFSGNLDFFEENTLKLPLLNDYEKKVLNEIKHRYFSADLPLIRKWFWPNYSKACAVLTHDVDWLYYSPFHKIVFKNKSLVDFGKLIIGSIFKRENFGNNLSQIVKMENDLNFKSTFMFKTKYPEDKDFQKKVLEVKESDCEIGLHAARKSHKDPMILEEEKKLMEETIKTKIYGIRHHHLKFNVPKTWRYEEKLGFEYDASFSYNECLGFRGRVCYPYHPFDEAQKEKFRILELPTSFMDWTVLSHGFGFENSLKRIYELMEVIENNNGCLVVNFHNTYINKKTFPTISKLYLKLLNEIKRRGYWVAKAKECHEWWIRRENVKIQIILEGGKLKMKSSLREFPILIESPKGRSKFLNLNESDLTINTF
jgi:hypothetical protein